MGLLKKVIGIIYLDDDGEICSLFYKIYQETPKNF